MYTAQSSSLRPAWDQEKCQHQKSTIFPHTTDKPVRHVSAAVKRMKVQTWCSVDNATVSALLISQGKLKPVLDHLAAVCVIYLPPSLPTFTHHGPTLPS